jgi:hypothetical protein
MVRPSQEVEEEDEGKEEHIQEGGVQLCREGGPRSVVVVLDVVPG